MVYCTPEEQQRWNEHLGRYQSHSNRYNPNRSSDRRYLFLAAEVTRLGSISRVITVHHVGRSTVHNALRFVRKLENETGTVLPQGEDTVLENTLPGSSVLQEVRQ